MVDFESILPPCNVKFLYECKSRKSALESAAYILGRNNSLLGARELLEKLTEREELASTALDDSGVAIPHCRSERCKRPVAALLRVEPDVQFGQEEWIKIIVALVVPSESIHAHLDLLKAIAIISSDRSNVTRLLATSTASELHETFMQLVRTVSNT